MIDTMKIVAPFPHADRIGGGSFISVDEDGQVLFELTKGKSLAGSYDSRIWVKTERPGYIAFECSPAKLFQGHNVFGSDDLVGLATETLIFIGNELGYPPSAQQIRDWLSGDMEVRRADLTYSWELPSRQDVLAYIRSMERTSTVKHRGKGQMSGDTLYYGKQSRRWSFKFYSKGQEIEAHKLPAHIQATSLPQHAQNLLRGELVLRSMELKKHGLDNARNWTDATAAETHAEKLQGLEMPTHIELPDEKVEKLPARLKSIYQLHVSGHDTREFTSRATWYRQRRELLDHGVDIGVAVHREDGHRNVVPLNRTPIEARPMANIPPWAHGTALYFEPRVAHG